PLAIEDITQDYPHFKDEVDTYESGRIVSWLGVPLMVKGQAIGVITLDRVQKRPYTAEEAQLAMTFASQAAIAIENARLYEVVRQELAKREQAQEALRRRAEELAALQATLLDITAPHDLPVLLQTIVERAARLLNALGGGMYLCDPDRGQVRCMVSHNTPRDHTGTVLEYGEGAAGTVAQTGEPLIIDDYRIWPGRAAVFEKEQPFTAVLSAPMIWQGQVTGVIHVLHDVESRCFTQADLELLTLFANHAAIAIENARLYELVRQELVKRERAQKELRQYAQRLRALRAIDGAILAAWSPQEVAQAAMRHVRKLIPCQRASVAVFDVGTDEATLIATHAGGETTVGAGTRLSPEDFGDSAAFRLGKHYVVEDIAALPRPTPTEQALCEEGVRSFMRLPLIAHGKLVGALSLGAGSPGSFAAEHVDIGRELADELAIGIQQARLHEQTQRHAEELEQQVAQRTRDLERRTLHLQVAAEVARDATTARDLDDLLNRAVNLIRERFEFYHAGIFLVDERDEYAVLRAATGEAGRHMLEQGHRLKVGEQGIVGDVTGSGQPHIALDVGADAVHFDNPLLPETRLEMALPLKVGERVIGALDVQSIREAAFDEESVAALQIMADQLAVAIEKTRLFEQTQAALEERLRTVVSNTPVILYALDRDGVCTFAEGKGLESLGAKPEDAIGQSVFDILADTPQIPEAARRALAGETSSLVVEIGGLTFEVWYSPLRDESGEITGVIGVATDTTERKHLEEQMRQQERMAAIGQLAGGIAHDFNNFLTSIMLYAQLLLAKPQLSPDMKRNVEVILDESRGAAQLVQQILDFSRRAMIETGPVDLKPFIEKTVDILKRTIPENIRLVVEIEPDEYAVAGEAGAPPFTVNADPTRIQQVLINLATNGRDAMPEGGELRIGLSRVEVRPDEKPPVAEMTAGEWVCLAISDTGAGMTEEVRSHLFEPFFTTKGPGLGTGLGLAQVHGIVGQHGGHIGVETGMGQGTTFRIYLPAHELEEADVQEEASTLLEGRGETILLVEDEEKVREASREMLESLGYRVLTAANGREALEVYRSAERVNLIITDLVMPEMGGKELARALKKEHPHARVLAITGYALEDDTEDLMEAGILDIIQKPFEVNRLAEIIRRVLDAE
ncbi:MAG: GAF domain-containing protein, partial [Chloroflexi bacterium]|nr:GAF domain-containing protein [Chloroflexota bacterium]